MRHSKNMCVLFANTRKLDNNIKISKTESQDLCNREYKTVYRKKYTYCLGEPLSTIDSIADQSLTRLFRFPSDSILIVISSKVDNALKRSVLKL